jgi:hypothetical protein
LSFRRAVVVIDGTHGVDDVVDALLGEIETWSDSTVSDGTRSNLLARSAEFNIASGTKD